MRKPGSGQRPRPPGGGSAPRGKGQGGRQHTGKQHTGKQHGGQHAGRQLREGQQGGGHPGGGQHAERQHREGKHGGFQGAARKADRKPVAGNKHHAGPNVGDLRTGSRPGGADRKPARFSKPRDEDGRRDRPRFPRDDHKPGSRDDRKPQRPPRQGERKPQRPAAEPERPGEPMRISKAMARAGLCSRRDAERWIAEGRVSVNGKVLASPALDVGPKDKVLVDGKPLPTAEPVRMWRYYKPRGLVTTHKDPQGRPTVFDALPEDLPRVVSIGRLDFNTEGLLLLTNDGALARHLELPATGWLRRYRVRAFGRVTQADLDKLKDGIEIEGVRYGPVEATLDSEQGANVWLTIGLREGKNREVRKILATFALEVNRLIRISYGPFQLLELKPGEAEPVKRRVLADELGPGLADELGLSGPSEEEAERRAARKQAKPGS